MKILLTLTILGAANLAFSQNLKGSKIEKQTNNPTYGQEYFHYKPGMKSIKLKFKPDLSENIFLSHPGSNMWVFGEDYAYDKESNSIVFLKDNIAIYKGGGKRGENVGDNGILWVFYRKEGEIKELKRKYGREVSVRTLDFLNSLKGDEIFKCNLTDKRLELTRIQDGKPVSTSYFYGEDIISVSRAVCRVGQGDNKGNKDSQAISI